VSSSRSYSLFLIVSYSGDDNPADGNHDPASSPEQDERMPNLRFKRNDRNLAHKKRDINVDEIEDILEDISF
jgi:hypothetical protein